MYYPVNKGGDNVDIINKRFIELRKSLNLTQREIGNIIGLSNSGISSIESGQRNVTDKHIKLLVSSLNVNESWLRTGEGDMFVENDNAILSLLQKEYNLPANQLAIIETFLSISENQRAAISEFAAELCMRLNLASTQPNNHAPKDKNDTINQELADYRKELEAEQRAQLVYEDSEEKKNGTK